MFTFLHRIPRPVLIVLLILFAAWISVFLYLRIMSDRNNRNVEFLFSLNEVREMCYADSYPVEHALARLEALNIKVALLEDLTLGEWLLENSLELISSPSEKLEVLGGNLYGRLGGSCILYSQDNKKLLDQKSFLEGLFGEIIEIKTRGSAGYLVLNEKQVWFLKNGSLGISKKAVEMLKNYNMKFAAAIPSDKQTMPELMGRAYFFDSLVEYVFVKGKNFLGYPDRIGLYTGCFFRQSLRLIRFEFYGQNGLGQAAKSMSHFVLPSHDLLAAGGNFVSQRGRLAVRFARALKERSVRLVMLHTFSDGGVEDNFIFFRNISRTAVKAGYTIESSLPYYRSNFLPRVQQSAALILAVFLPFVLVHFVIFMSENSSMTWGSVLSVFLLTNAVTLAGALSIYAVLSTAEFTLRIYQFRGVKIALLLPVLYAVYKFIEKYEWKDFFDYALKIKHIAYFSLVAVAVLIIVLRSGNASIVPSMPLEGYVRDFFDGFMGIRPRFKEFMFGQPMLLLGLWLWIRKGAVSLFNSRLGRVFTAAGFLGQTTIINTFTHAHTPVLVSITRTLYGAFFGLLIGLILIMVFSLWKEQS